LSREAIKLEMIRERTDRRGTKCDLCGERFHYSLEMHEIIERHRTIGNEKARELSFQKELCALLCRECHEKAPAMEEVLWVNNMRRYGADRVHELVAELQAHYPILINLSKEG
jgi:5-methylcytosine-specific restriction endonuclease McrA